MLQSIDSEDQSAALLARRMLDGQDQGLVLGPEECAEGALHDAYVFHQIGVLIAVHDRKA